MLTVAFYHVSCVGLTIFCCLFCSVHRENLDSLMKNACKQTISKVFFDCPWNQPNLFIWNFREGLMALLKRGHKKHCFLSCPSLKGLMPTLSHPHVFWGWRKKPEDKYDMPKKKELYAMYSFMLWSKQHKDKTVHCMLLIFQNTPVVLTNFWNIFRGNV